MHKDLVSVIMPIHNAEKYLDQAVSSIVNQTYKKLEIICIENGSKDKSLSKLKHYSKIYKNFVIIKLKKASLSNALNKGILRSKGEYIARMDADDISHPKRIEKQVKYLKKKKSISIVGSNINLIDAEGKFIKKIYYPQKFNKLKKKLEVDSYLAHPSVMMRKKIFKILKGYRFQFCPAEDYDLWLRALHFFKIENMREFLVNYRQHSNKMGSLMEFQTVLGATYARELYLRRLKLKTKKDKLILNRLVNMEDLIKIGVNKFYIFKHLANIIRKNKFKIFGYHKIFKLILIR